MMTTKRNKRGREAGAPANLTQQPTKEQEGLDGATSGGGAGRRLLSWSSLLPYATLWRWAKTTMKMTTTKHNKRGREAGAPANLMQQPTKEQEGREGATSGSSDGRQSLLWLLTSLYQDVVAMGKNDNKNNDNKAQ